jgi:ATP-dependent helicase/DNAse subunit B
MRVLLGAPGSGKTTRVLNEIRELPRARRDDFRLLVPTATMAEHLRHQLAREGFRLRASCVSTLREFIEPWITSQPAGDASRQLYLAAILERACPPDFKEVAAFDGFRDALLRAVDQLADAGCDSLQLAALDGMGIWRGGHTRSIRLVCEALEAELKQRKEALRPALLLEARDKIVVQGLPGITRLYLDGFFSFSLAERQLLEAASKRVPLTLTLAEWPGATASLDAFRKIGASVERLDVIRAVPETILVSPSTRQIEAEEIARRIRQEAAAGRLWREMGVIVRAGSEYVPLLRTTFARFGIPAHFHFAEKLCAHPVTRRLRQEAAEFSGSATPAHWMTRCSGLGKYIDGPDPAVAPSRESALRFALRARAWKGWLEALEETVAALPEEPLTSAEFLAALDTVLESSQLRPPPSPRNSVAVMDVVESRQWELPVVFVAGLLEGEFPSAPSADPLLPEDLRLRLRDNGVALDTAADRQRLEHFYLDVALSRATVRQVLSWPAYNSDGDATLASFVLADRFPQTHENYRPCRPVPLREVPKLEPRQLAGTALRRKPESVSVTALESFLQCPFQYFGRHDLGLRAPLKALDQPALGRFLHEFLKLWHESQMPPFEPFFDAKWAHFLQESDIKGGFQVELERLDLLRSLRLYCANPRLTPGWRLELERDLHCEIDGVSIKMRADRIDTSPAGDSALFDFKRSAPDGLKARVTATLEGRALQGGLYPFALERAGGKPVSFQFIALHNGIGWRGWTKPEALAPVISTSREAAASAIKRIAGGSILPQPADLGKCDYCDFRHACRVDVAAAKDEMAFESVG